MIQNFNFKMKFSTLHYNKSPLQIKNPGRSKFLSLIWILMAELTLVADLYSYRAVSEVVVKGIVKFSKFCSLFRLRILFLVIRISAVMNSL